MNNEEDNSQDRKNSKSPKLKAKVKKKKSISLLIKPNLFQSYLKKIK